MNERTKFIKNSEKKAFNLKHRSTLIYNISKYDFAFKNGLSNYKNLDNAKQFISSLKSNAIENLLENLLTFEENSIKNGTNVIWASNASDALIEIEKIAIKHKCKLAVKSKSMISEELELNKFLTKIGVNPIETDLGEFIVQLAGETPYHILTPAMHKSKEDVSLLFRKSFGTPENSSPQFIAEFVRKYLREKFVSADIGITGANFLIADIGGIALTENEGNGLMTVSFPKIHIIITGIEKIVPSVDYLGKIWPVLSQHGTGQKVTAYNSILRGTRKDDEVEGSDYVYVILLDNGRSKLFEMNSHVDALKCIRCGACLNACPIYKNIGGHTFNTPYSGPIGSVITPIFKGKDFDHLSFACTVCGKCTDTCPVKIPLHELLLLNRQLSVKRNKSISWNTSMKIYEYIMKKRNRFDFMNGDIKNLLLKFGKRHWGSMRELPFLSKKSFNRKYRNQFLKN